MAPGSVNWLWWGPAEAGSRLPWPLPGELFKTSFLSASLSVLVGGAVLSASLEGYGTALKW